MLSKMPKVLDRFSKILFSIIFIGIIFLILPTSVNAATYYVRADGTVTAANKANATSPNNANTALNMAQFKLATFVAGDQILFSSQGGNYTEVMTLPSGGSGVGNEITYAKVPSETPLVAITSGYLLDTNSRSNIIVDGLTFNYTGTSASTNIGTIIRAGSNLQFKNITSNMGGYGYVMWSSSILSNVTFDSVTLTSGTPARNAIHLTGSSNSNVTIQNSTLNPGIQVNNATDLTLTNTSWLAAFTVSTGSDVTITDSPHAGGITLNTVTTGIIEDVSISSGTAGVLFTDSSDITVNDTDVSNATSYGAFQVSGTSHNITFNRCTANNNSINGFVQEDTSNDIEHNNCTANNNLGIGFLARESSYDITYRYSEASYNGTLNTVTDGGGFLPHDLANDIKCYYCVSIGNYNQGSGDVSDGSNNAFYNGVTWRNGYASGDTFRGNTVSTPSVRSNVYYRKTNGGSFVVNNGIFGGGKPRELLDTQPAYTTLDYNLYKPLDNNKFFSTDAVNDVSWTTYHSSNEANSINNDPLFTNGSGSYSVPTDFQLTYLSPAIDSGTDVGLTVDYIGNPIYGTPDIGAYEYQPPYTMGTDEIDINGDVRVYEDGKFRNTQTVSGTTADLTVTPSGGFGAGDYSEWMDITITTWDTSGTYKKVWSEESSSIGSASTVHTVGDLQPNRQYSVKVNNVLGQNVTGGSCSGGYCTSNSSGEISFTYTGGYSTVNFEVEKDVTSPSITLNPISPDPTTDNTPTITGTATDTVGTVVSVEYQIDSTSGSWSSCIADDGSFDEASETFSCTPPESSRTSHTIFVRATDSNGNTTSSGNYASDAFTIAPNSSSSNDDDDKDDNECHDDVGIQPPWLYGAIAQNSNSILLYFTEAADPVDRYAIKYGTKSGEYIYGADNLGIKSESRMTYLVKELKPNTTYYFKVRGGNGCKPGDWSNEMKATTKSAFSYNNLEFTSSTLESTPLTQDDLDSSGINSTNDPTTTSENVDKEAMEEIVDTEGYTVKVRVIDEQGNPVEGAKVTMHSRVQETTSDKDGYAIFNNVEKGDHRVIIAYNGYEGEQALNLTGDVREFSLEIKIKPQNVFYSPIYLWSIGIFAVITTILVILLIRRRK